MWSRLFFEPTYNILRTSIYFKRAFILHLFGLSSNVFPVLKKKNKRDMSYVFIRSIIQLRIIFRIHYIIVAFGRLSQPRMNVERPFFFLRVSFLFIYLFAHQCTCTALSGWFAQLRVGSFVVLCCSIFRSFFLTLFCRYGHAVCVCPIRFFQAKQSITAQQSGACLMLPHRIFRSVYLHSSFNFFIRLAFRQCMVNTYYCDRKLDITSWPK